MIGKSGAGKTTLLKAIAGRRSITTGSISINGKKQLRYEELLIPGFSDLAFVNQHFDFDPHQRVMEVLRLAMSDLNESAKQKFCDELLDLVDLKSHQNKKTKFISGGERQRLSLIFSLALEKEYLLLDEPFTNMDNAMRLSVMNYLKKLREYRDTCVLVVSHQAEEILSLCDQVLYLKGGKRKRMASPEAFYHKPQSIEEGQLFGAINAIKLDGKRVLFRPTHYELNNPDGIPVEFVSADFHGGYWASNFITANKEQIVLFNLQVLNEVTHVIINKPTSQKD